MRHPGIRRTGLQTAEFHTPGPLSISADVSIETRRAVGDESPRDPGVGRSHPRVIGASSPLVVDRPVSLDPAFPSPVP